MLCSLSFYLSLSRVYRESLSSPLNLCFFPSTQFPYLLHHAIFYMVSEREGWEPLQPTQLEGETNEEEQEERWIEAWRARFQQRSSTETTTHLVHTRCTSTCSGTVTRAMSKERMTRHSNRRTKTPLRGNNRRVEYCTALHLVCTVCTRENTHLSLSLSLCLSVPRVYRESLSSPLNLRFFPSTQFP